MAKSRSETVSIELRVGSRKPSAFAVIWRSIGKPVPASAAAPIGDFVHVLDGVANARAIPAEHLDIGHAVVAEGDWLCSLQMREAGHHGLGMLFGPVEEGSDQPGQRLLGALQLLLDPKPEIECDLVVARAGSMQAPGRRADQYRQPRLDVHMDVFELAGEFEIATFDL